MAATTIETDPHDHQDAVTIAAGGTPGTKGLSIVIDWSKYENEAQVRTALLRAAQRITDDWPLPSA